MTPDLPDYLWMTTTTAIDRPIIFKLPLAHVLGIFFYRERNLGMQAS